LNKIVAKSAFIRHPIDDEPLRWYDGSLVSKDKNISPPPLWTKWEWPKDRLITIIFVFEISIKRNSFLKFFHSEPFYRSSIANSFTKTHFTETIGVQYRKKFEEMRDALLWAPQIDAIDDRLLHRSQNEHHYL
jgi:hypothetical protein